LGGSALEAVFWRWCVWAAEDGLLARRTLHDDEPGAFKMLNEATRDDLHDETKTPATGE